MDLASQAFAALRWNLIVRVSGQAVTWAMTVLIMRLLTPADYGLLAMAMVFVDYVSILGELGIGAAIVQAPEIDRRKLRQVFGLALLTNAGVAVLVFASGAWVAQFYGEPRLTSIVRVFALQFLMNGLMVIPRGLAQRKLDFRTLSLVQLGAMIAGGLLTLAMAAEGSGVWALVSGNLLNNFLQLVALNIAWPFLHWPLFSLSSARQMISFGANVTGTGLLWLFWSQSDVLIAGRLLGKDLVGAYSVGIQIASMPATRFSQIVTQVAFSVFARLQHDPEAIRFQLIRSLRIVALGAFPVFWGISCIAPELIAVAIGPRWSAAVLPLQVLALAMPVRLLGMFTSAVVRSFGRADVDFRNTLATVLIMPLAFYAGCRWGGLTGLSAVWITAFPCVFLWTSRNLFRAVGLRISELLRVITIPWLAAGCMYAATMLLRWWAQPWLGAIPLAALLAAAGAAVYCGIVWALDRATVKSMAKLLQSVLRTRTPSVSK